MNGLILSFLFLIGIVIWRMSLQFFQQKKYKSFINRIYPVNKSKSKIQQKNVTFIHIPKTGGSSLELALFHKGILIGSTQKKAPYNTSEKLNCSFWHKPPLQNVEKSFVVVRNPFERVISEFCYEIHESHTFLKPSCNGLNTFLFDALEKYYNRNQKDIFDCHLIPQWEYSKHSSIILSFKDIRTKDFWDKISKLYNMEIKMTHENMRQEFCRNISYGCFTNESRTLIRAHFRDDFEHLNLFF